MLHIDRKKLCNPTEGKCIYIPLSATSKTAVVSATSKTAVESNAHYYIQIRDLEDYTIVRLTPFNDKFSLTSINKDDFFSTYTATIPVTSGKKTLSTREELNSFLSKVLSDNAAFIIASEGPTSDKPLIRFIQAELEAMGKDAAPIKKRFSKSLQSFQKTKAAELAIEAPREPQTQPAISSLELNAAPHLIVSLSAPKPQNQYFFKQTSPMDIAASIFGFYLPLIMVAYILFIFSVAEKLSPFGACFILLVTVVLPCLLISITSKDMAEKSQKNTFSPETQPAISSLESSVSLNAPKPQNQYFFKQASTHYKVLSCLSGFIGFSLGFISPYIALGGPGPMFLALIASVVAVLFISLAFIFNFMAEKSQKNTFSPAQAL